MTGPEFDLDTPPAGTGQSGTGQSGTGPLETGTGSAEAVSTSSSSLRRWITLLALAMVGAAAGAVLAAAPAGQPRPPITSILSPLHTTVATGPTVALRLSISNAGPGPVTVVRLALAGGDADRSFRLSARVEPGATRTTDVTMHPECGGPAGGPAAAGAGRGPLTARATMDDGSELAVLLDDRLTQRGGLCALLDDTLPPGWRSRLEAAGPRVDGGDLILSIPGLKGQFLATFPAGRAGVTELNAYAGDDLILAEFTADKTLRLLGPPPCLDDGADGAASIPMSVHTYLDASDGLNEVLIEVGPQLAIWLTDSCSR